MFGPFGKYPTGTIPPEDSHAVSDPFANLELDPSLELQHLIELYPYDDFYEPEIIRLPNPIGSAAFGQLRVKGRGGVRPIYLADRQFITEPEDTPANQYYEPVVNNPLQFDISIMSGNNLGYGGSSFGAIEIQNGDGSLDHLLRMRWKGRRIVVKAGRVGWGYGSFLPVFDGYVNGIEATDGVLMVTFRDPGLKIETDIVSETYAGTGGLEGNNDLAGKMKPLLYGECFNFEPVLVDAVNLVYQIHAGSVEEISDVFDAGVALTFGSDVPDITASTPSAGHFNTCKTMGLIKLGSTPAGRITADAKGDNTGGYVSTVAAISRRIVQTKIGSMSLTDDEIDLNSFEKLDGELSGAAGIYILDRVPVRRFLDELITPCAAYWYFNRLGLLSCEYVDIASMAGATITEDFIDTAGIDVPTPIPPSWRISVAYAPSWTIQKENEIAGAAQEARRAFAGQQYRIAVSENAMVLERDAYAGERVFYTNLAEKSDAEALLERLVRIYGVERRVYRVPVYGALFRNYIGDAVRLTYPRFNIDKTLAIVGISENAERGQTLMELWG